MKVLGEKRGTSIMTKQVGFWLLVALFAMTFAACHGPMLGVVTEVYVNQSDREQTLEITAKETLKGFVHGRSANPVGSFILFREQKALTGKYSRVNDTYVLSADDREFKLTLQKDS